MKTAASDALLRENAELRARLGEAEETLQAIRSGDVDALVVGKQVYSLEGAETPYRVLFEAMSEGAATLAEDGTVLYANRRLAEMMHSPLEALLGLPFRQFVSAADQPVFDALLKRSRLEADQCDLSLQGQRGETLPAQLSCSVPGSFWGGVFCIVATDLTERKQAQEALRERAQQMEQFNAAAVGRELRMIELKAEVNDLARQLDRPPPYNLEDLVDSPEKPS